ncbi:hypothetical protein PaG_04917 [Moesziomyces aphidis]|uniref:Autophagy-related protein 2 n=1 Tax=Moesziomyces aphidis TaxID=84754 RepID=W3VJP9_MOEAP|nr:hypothetical protein PaG_04917 [Moesziomyces aphidis]
MASYFLPSFLTGWELPSVSAFSLSANLQKRILSYLLKRTLGHFVDGGQLDPTQLDAGIGSGRIEIRDIELDAAALNQRLAHLPVSAASGRIAKILIQLPVPNFWSGELSVLVSGISIRLEPSLFEAPSSDSFADGLAASFASAASEILFEDAEAKDLEESIHQSISADTPADAHKADDDQPGTLIASYIEALLTRLKITVNDVDVALASDDVELSIRLQSANVHSSNTRSERTPEEPLNVEAEQSDVSSSSTTSLPSLFSETARTLEFHGLEVWLQDRRNDGTGDERDSSSSSDTSPEDDSQGEGRLPTMDMDQSIASLQESSASLYQSAIQEDTTPAGIADHADSKRSDLGDSTEPRHQINPTHRLFSMGQEPVIVTLKTIKERRQIQDAGASTRRTIQRLVRTTTSVDVQIGNVASILFIEHVGLLMILMRRLARRYEQSNDLPASATDQVKPSRLSSRASSGRSIDFSCRISSLNIILGYDDAIKANGVTGSIDAFWARPSRSHPDFGHLRLRCDGLAVTFKGDVGSPALPSKPPSVNVTVDDIGVFEHLSSSLFQHAPPEASRVLPILLLDPNLVRASDWDTAAGKHPRHDYARSTVEVFDWRYSVPQATAYQAVSSSSQDSPRATRFRASEPRSASSQAGQTPYYRASYGERGWKLKPPSKSTNTSPGPATDPAQPYIRVSVTPGSAQGGRGNVVAYLAPVHCFVDVSLVTRLLPALHKFAGAQIAAMQAEARPSRFMDGSIATLASSIATLQPSGSELLDDMTTQSNTVQQDGYDLDVKVSFVRTEIRTPQVSYSAAALAGRDLRSARQFGLDKRAGVLVVQVQDLEVRSGPSLEDKPRQNVRFAHQQTRARPSDSDAVVTGCIRAKKVSAFLGLPADARALVLVSMDALDADKGTNGPFADPDAGSLPQVQFSRISIGRPPAVGALPSDEAQNRCKVILPCVKVELGKRQLDSLQYIADDLTQLGNIWGTDDPDDNSADAEGLKILGSRFFGSRAGMSIISASTDSTATATARASSTISLLHATIIRASIRIWLPHLDGGEETLGTGAGITSKSLLLLASDFEVLLNSDKVRNTTRIEARVPEMQLSVEARISADQTSSSVLAARTVERDLDSRGHDSMLVLVLEAYTEPGTSYREQNVEVVIGAVKLSPCFDQDLVPRVKRLLKAPAGVFENVEPNEVTRISFKAKDCSVYVAPPDTAQRAVLSIDEASVKTKLTSHAPKTSIKLAVANVDFWAIESEASLAPKSSSVPQRASQYWVHRGFARILHVPESKGSIHLTSMTRPEVDVRITKLRVKVQMAADTLEVITGISGSISSLSTPSSPQANTKARSRASPKSHDVEDEQLHAGSSASSPMTPSDGHFAKMAELMSGIEDDAYRHAVPLPVSVDLVDDDVPSDATFLGAKGRYHPEIVETTLDADEFFGGESVASLSLAAPRTDTVIYADDDVTVRLLDPNGIRPVLGYFTDSQLRPQVESALGPAASSVRVRVSDFDLSLRLHSGYDWATTRQAVESEAKSVRRRLQKIKQLLADGQVPDDSVEAATSNLLDSVHISLPQLPSQMAPDEMMQAVRDELGDHSDSDDDDSASWQTLPAPRSGQSSLRPSARPTTATPGSGRHAKLQRSARSLIDFNFRGLEVEFDQADPSQPSHIASRIAVAARRFEIIDNIRTSTWQTFLTEMRDQNSAMHRDAAGKMVRVELLNVRPQGGASADGSAFETPEVRMRAKIAPLRLHVDQDALDFLKKFFTFKPPGRKTVPVEAPAGTVLPFIQFAEVLPIKIKLDYKPKRVDYNLLRQGKTIEMMNFFHFEGSEMVLRHITLRGISGWPRLFDSLNDIWTPDVKANQLADFLSGLGPIRSLVNVGAGLADLVLLPIEQYHKDGRVLRGVQRGATSFAKSTALEAVKLGARLATGTQVILEQAEHILGGELPETVTARAVGPEGEKQSYESLSESIMLGSTADVAASWIGQAGDRGDGEVPALSKYAMQPEGMRDALTQAYSGLTEGLTAAAQTILAIPMDVYEPETSDRSGPSSGATGRPIVKAVPIAILRGARGATHAIAKTMQGAQVSLGDSENARERKYKLPTQRTAARRQG